MLLTRAPVRQASLSGYRAAEGRLRPGQPAAKQPASIWGGGSRSCACGTCTLQNAASTGGKHQPPTNKATVCRRVLPIGRGPAASSHPTLWTLEKQSKQPNQKRRKDEQQSTNIHRKTSSS